MRDLRPLDEPGGQEVLRYEQQGHGRAVHGALDLGEPGVSLGDPAVVPDVEIGFQDLQVPDDTVFPILVLMAVAQEDRGPMACEGGIARFR